MQLKKSFYKDSLVLCTLLLGMLCLVGCRVRPDSRISPHGNQCNVLLITVDTLRADHLGCYGYEEIRTPTIDRLAREGVQFLQAFTPVPITLPSHASIMTGLLPAVHGVKDNGIFMLEDDFLTLAEVLHGKGYRCGAFVGSFILDARFGLAQGFDIYNDRMAPAGSQDTSLYQERKGETVAQAAIRFLDDDTPDPFFAWVHYFDPHIPYDPPGLYRKSYEHAPYDGEIAYTDTCIGELLDALERNGKLDSTLIVLTADHGEGLGEHGERTHGLFIYDATLHIPLIMRYPGHLPQGKRLSPQVRTIDIFPTILDVLGCDAASCDGETLLPYVYGKREAGLDLLCASEYPYRGFGWAPLEGIRTEGWKYIHAPRPELYELHKDPGERKNLFRRAPQQAAALHARLNEAREDLVDRTHHVKPVAVDDLTRKRLLSLGYVVTGDDIKGGDRMEVQNLPDPKDKASVVAALDLGMAAYVEGDLMAARKRLRSVLTEDPGNLLANFLLGSVYQEEGDFGRALEAFRHVVRNNPDYLDIHQHLGEIYLNLGDHERALREFMQAARVDLGRTEALNSMGAVYFSRGEYAKAISALREATAIDSGSHELHFNLGVALEQSGDIEGAIKEYQTTLDLLPGHAQAWNHLGHAYGTVGMTDDAVSCLSRAIALDPTQAEFHNNLGLVYTKMGRTGNAIEEFEKALRLDPDLTAPHYNLAVINYERKDFQPAKEGFRKVIAVDPSCTDAYYSLAVIYATEGDITRAMQLLREATRIRPDFLRAHTLMEKIMKKGM